MTILSSVIILIVLFLIFTVAVHEMFHVTWKKAFRDMGIVLVIVIVAAIISTLIQSGGVS